MVNIPQVICIQFINYYYNQKSQNAERVQFNLIINEEIHIESTIFSFKCALLHNGGRNSGHYQVLLKHKNNFYLYNDALVSKIDGFQYSDFNEKYEMIMYVQNQQ